MSVAVCVSLLFVHELVDCRAYETNIQHRQTEMARLVYQSIVVTSVTAKRRIYIFTNSQHHSPLNLTTTGPTQLVVLCAVRGPEQKNRHIKNVNHTHVQAYIAIFTCRRVPRVLRCCGT